MALTAAERQKRYRERLKESDPQKYERIRLKHLQKVKENSKKIQDMTEHQKERQREKWRIANAKRIKKNANTPETKDSREPKKIFTSRKYFHIIAENEKMRKKVENFRRNTYRYKKIIAKLRKKLAIFAETIEAIKTETTRCKPLNVSPLTKTERFLAESLPGTSDQEKDRVKKKILQLNTLTESLKNQYNRAKTNDERRVLKGIVDSEIVDKYKMKTELTISMGLKGRVRKTKIKGNLQKKWEAEIRNFFLRDDVSRQSAGKQECKTYKKIKAQKKYLLDTTKKLYEKYKVEKGPAAASYATFMRYKPFFIVKPRIQDRETCACIRHSNLTYKIVKLKKLGVIKTLDVKELLSEITCSETYECMYSKCEQCIEKLPLMDVKHKEMTVQWLQWKLRTHAYETFKKDTVEKKTTKKYAKEIVEGTLGSLTEEFVADLHKFKKHYFNIIHQGRSLRKRIDNLDEKEVIIVCDFSENYSCKFREEIQAIHFGSSRRQITLHTSVVYKKGVKPISICSISPVNDHGPAAIWAHMHPVITYCKNELLADVLHVYSDGPSTQYKQKNNFYLFSKRIADYDFTYGTWNYFEASHGKGPADGVGGAIKRKLDQHVAHGHDITNAEEAYKFLVDNTNIKIFYITDSDITDIKKMIPDKVIPVKGTQNVHQIISHQPASIKYRDLSCFDCGKQEKYCQHFNLKYHNLLTKENSVITISDNKPQSKKITKKSENVLKLLNVDQRQQKTLNNEKHNKVTILSDVKYSKENKKFYGLSNVPNILNKISADFDLFSGKALETHDLSFNKNNIKPKVSTKSDPKVNINVHGCLSDDEEHTTNQSNLNFHSKKNKRKRSLIMKSVSEKLLPAKRSKRSSVSTTTIESSDFSMYSDTDVLELESDEMCDNDNDINNDSQCSERDRNFNQEEKCDMEEIGPIDRELEAKSGMKMSEITTALEIDKLPEVQAIINNEIVDNSQDITGVYKDNFFFNVGDHILVRYYERKSWKYYIGIIENIDVDSKIYRVNYYKTVNKNDSLKFVKPKRLDQDDVPDVSIVKRIELLQFSESPEEYVLNNDEDQVYF